MNALRRASRLHAALLLTGALTFADVARAGQPGDTLVAGSTLSNDGAIVSKNGGYKAVLQASDGNFVVYRTASNEAVWADHVTGGAGWSATMQGDGNFVVYDRGRAARWATGTNEVKPTGQYFLRIEDTGVLNVYRGSTAQPDGVIWSSAAGRRYKIESDADIAEAFRPHFRFSKDTRCFGLTFAETGTYFTNYCRKSFDGSFVVVANVVRPPSGTGSNTDGNSFRVTYGMAFGWQDGTITGTSQAILSDFTDVGAHDEDAQYLVVDVVDGHLTSAWADLHQGDYARPRGGLTMISDNRLVAWVGAYYHPFKLTTETSSVCKSETEGSYGLSSNVTSGGLRFTCAGTCGSARSCSPWDTFLNWGDPGGSDSEGDGKLVMANDVCSASGSYVSPDGVTYGKSSLEGLQGYVCGSLPSGAAGNWKHTFKSKSAYSSPYNLNGCDEGNTSGGRICNGALFASGATWKTSLPTNNLYLEGATAGAVNVHYQTGTPFSDLDKIAGAPASITIRTGDRVDAVSTTWTSDVMGIANGLTGTQTHGGTGGGPATLGNLRSDPVVLVRLCSATSDGKVRTGAIKLVTRGGAVQQGGKGSDNCVAIAPTGKILYGFYGRAGDELDALGTIWGDPPSAASPAPVGPSPR